MEIRNSFYKIEKFLSIVSEMNKNILEDGSLSKEELYSMRKYLKNAIEKYNEIELTLTGSVNPDFNLNYNFEHIAQIEDKIEIKNEITEKKEEEIELSAENINVSDEVTSIEKSIAEIEVEKAEIEEPIIDEIKVENEEPKVEIEVEKIDIEEPKVEHIIEETIVENQEPKVEIEEPNTEIIQEEIMVEKVTEENTITNNKKENIVQPSFFNQLFATKTEEQKPKIIIENEDTAASNFIPIVNEVSIVDQHLEKNKNEENLIDKFEDSNKDNVNDTFENEVKSENIHTKILKNIAESITLNDKFIFVRELFANQFQEYELSLKLIDSFGDYTVAKRYCDEQLSAKYNWKEKEKIATKFLELVERKFNQ